MHSKLSNCSSLTLRFLIQQGQREPAAVLLCTDHGTNEAYSRLSEALPNHLVIPAIEVETEEGDFLVFSDNVEYINSLKDFDGSITDLKSDDHTAIIWAHPCVNQRESVEPLTFAKNGPYRDEDEERIAKIVHKVDAVELFNGTILSLAALGLVNQTYFDNLKLIAKRHHLAVTGGSDAHEEETWGKAWTEFPGPITSIADFILALKERRTRPDYDHDFFSLPEQTQI
ncbi:MAG: PHP domain-containing protein [Deltaproteobacteria bacterium]|nr:PHP domain-containing protein [Deltaproteobacteria bacterium]